MNISVVKIKQAVALTFVSASLSLAGCGGGGETATGSDDATQPTPGPGDPGGSGAVPKTATASFSDSAADANRVTGFVVGANSSDSTTPPVRPDPGNDYDTFSVPLGAAGSSVSASNSRLKVTSEPTGCDIVFVESPIVESCEGDILIASNFDEYGLATEFPAGAYQAFSFDGVSVVTVLGEQVNLGGEYRFTAKGSEPAQFIPNRRGDFLVELKQFVDLDEEGRPLDPIDGTFDVTYHDDDTVSLIIDGARYREYQIFRGDSDQSYYVESGSVITAFGDGYAELVFDNWSVIDGIPQLGSQVTVNGRNNARSVIVVAAASATELIFDVSVSANGVTRNYSIPATITADGITI